MFISKTDSGLRLDSKIKCNQIRTVDRSRLVRFESTITAAELIKVEKALLIHVGILRSDF